MNSPSHRQAGKPPLMARSNPRHLFSKNMAEKNISVFVDEYGSFDQSADSSRYYLLCFVLHDQSEDITEAVAGLEEALDALGVGRNHCIHAGPLIRREREYANMLREARRRILGRMMSFIRKVDFRYKCFALDKKFVSGEAAIHDSLLQRIVRFLIDKSGTLNGYDRLKVYYDDGQPQIKHLLKEAFALFAAKTVFAENVLPENYRMFQVADVLCTLELTRMKLLSGERLSRSEFDFFNGIQNLRKNYIKPLARKEYR